MKRQIVGYALAVTAALVTVAVRADVKTTEKTTFKMEGLLGSMLNRAMGGADGISSTVALKGNRLSRMMKDNGEIIDLTEQKVYQVDLKKKEYTVKTFAEMRAEIEKMKADAEKQAAGMKPEERQQAEQAAKEIEFDVAIKETGQRKTIAGHDAKETVMTITMREKGKKVEESGGMIMTSSLWLAPKVAALDEVMTFNMKYFDAIYGGLISGFDPRQMASIGALLPGFGSLAQKMAAEGQKLQGTAVQSTTVFEGVKSAEQMKAAASQQQSSCGGLGGMLAGRFNRGATEQRTKALTTTHEYLSIATAASPEDVAIPAGFKEKK